MSELGTYQGASTIMRKTFDWNRRIWELLLLALQPFCLALAAYQISKPYTQLVGLLGRRISPSQGTNKQNKRTLWHRASSKNRTHGPSKTVHAVDRATAVIAYDIGGLYHRISEKLKILIQLLHELGLATSWTTKGLEFESR
jgi:hypothetical protein